MVFGIFDMKNKVERDNAIDGLRFVMILIIILFHSCKFGTAYNIGMLGDIFFFMISGYLLYGTKNIYQKCKDGESIIELHTFIFRRLKGIYPAYILSLLSMMLLTGVRNITHLFANVTLTCSGWFWDDLAMNGSMWFLSVLLLVYILFYYMNRFVSERNMPYLIFAILLTSYMLCICHLEIPFLYSQTMLGITAFMLGQMLRYAMGIISRKAKKIILIMSIIICLLLFFGTMLLGMDRVMGDSTFVYLFMIVPAIIVIGINSQIARALLAAKPIAFLGRISMFLYVWHVPFLYLTKRLTGRENIAIDNISQELIYLALLFLFCIAYSYADKALQKRFVNIS